MTILVAGVLLGLAGSAHCAAMCGPLVLAMEHGSSKKGLRSIAAYHAGRVLIYLVLGLTAGLAGYAVSSGGLGRVVSIASGLFLLVLAARGGSPATPARGGRRWALVLARLSLAAGRTSRTHTVAGPLLTGMVNGVLPCGLVYAAAISASALGDVAAAVIFMAGFGLGTSPVLIVLALSARSFPPALRSRLRRLAPAALVLTGALLIVRGVMPAHQEASTVARAAATHAH